MRNQHNLASEVAIVLGGGISSTGIPNIETLLRAEAGVKLAKARADLSIIASGGTIHTGPLAISEAEAMARIFESNGIPRSRLLLEEEARDTLGNALLVAARFLKGVTPRKIYVVTSPFHSERAMSYFCKVFPPAWDLSVVLADKAEDDAARCATEPGGIEWGKKFFKDINPGDLRTMISRLLQERPIYNSIAWLRTESEALKCA